MSQLLTIHVYGIRLPAIDDALRSARLSYAKVRALTRVATPDNEAKLLEMALVATGAQLGRLLPGGMVKLELVLEPDEADLILRAVEHAQEAQPPKPGASGASGAPAAQGKEEAAEAAGASAETSWPSRADGAVKLAESFLAGNPVRGTGGERFQVMVHLDQ